MQPVIDVQGAQPQRRALELRQRGKQSGGVRPTAESDAHGEVGEAGQKLCEAPAEGARAKPEGPVEPRAWHGLYAAVSANTPKPAILAARVARS